MIMIKIRKPEDTKMCVMKCKLKFEGFQHCLEKTQVENKINQL